MTPCAALLRAVNLGPHNKVSMAALRRLCGEAGLLNATTILQSGNVVFDSPFNAAKKVEGLCESVLDRRLGVSTAVCVRTLRDWKALVRANPFPHEAAVDPAHLVVVFLKGTADPASVKLLQAGIVGNEIVRGRGAELYVVYPDGIGSSKLTIKVIERAVGSSGTARNWNTVLKIDSELSRRAAPT